MDTKQFRPGLNISSLCYFLTQCRFPKKRHNGTVSFSRCKLDAPGSRKIGIFRFSLLFSNKLEVALINFQFEDFYYYVLSFFLLYNYLWYNMFQCFSVMAGRFLCRIIHFKLNLDLSSCLSPNYYLYFQFSCQWQYSLFCSATQFFFFVSLFVWIYLVTLLVCEGWSGVEEWFLARTRPPLGDRVEC